MNEDCIVDQVRSLGGDCGLMILLENVLVLRRCVLKCSEVKCHVFYLHTSGSVK